MEGAHPVEFILSRQSFPGSPPLREWFVSLDVGKADQDDPLAPAALHFNALLGHFGQQVPALAAALLGEV